MDGLTPRLAEIADPSKYIDQGGNRMGEVEVINHGPGDVYELDVTAEEKAGLLTRDDGEFPVPKLPAGKSQCA